jgi:hypothetical protein
MWRALRESRRAFIAGQQHPTANALAKRGLLIYAAPWVWRITSVGREALRQHEYEETQRDR